ncbi:hypothetical protein JIG36_28535 [Actinoplanes sp. LDG1-06]|uniref:DUF3995 domain-containing protein n=2 Tax=Paractinoplanes ovalisporus TaxID=2810368 RepID=A0ABS2AJG5_9ACTN|nr:hypothetical protein [Actinoplanes ovalisporus]
MEQEPLLNKPAPVPTLWDGPVYVIMLSLVSELLAFLTVGLVATWGEVVPRWVPGLGGRRIPVLAAVVPAAIGATICTVLWPYAMTMLALGRKMNGDVGIMQFNDWQALAFWGTYTPLVLWGPLVWIATVHYWRRRTRVTSPAEPTSVAG